MIDLNIKKKGAWVINFSLLILSLLTAWLILELTLPLYLEKYGPFVTIDTEGMGHSVRPGALGSNRFGFNDRDYPLQKSPGSFRILIVGDSFNWPGGQEWNYTKILERLFEDYFGKHVIDVINVGYPQTHTGNQVVMLRRYGLRYNPDLVILGFFVGNDFSDYGSPPFFESQSTERGYNFLCDLPPFGKRVFTTVRGAARIVLAMKADYFKGGKIMRNLPAMPESAFYQTELARMSYWKRTEVSSRSNRALIEEALKNIDIMSLDVRRTGARFILAAYPDEYQVDLSLQNELAERFSIKINDYDLDRPQQILADFSAREGFQFIDLLPRFRKQGSYEALYLYRNTHWNKAGNTLAAQIFFDALLPIVVSEVSTSQ